MGEYAEMEIAGFINSLLENDLKGPKQKQQQKHEIESAGLTWRQKRNLRNKARKKRQKERMRESQSSKEGMQ